MMLPTIKREREAIRPGSERSPLRTRSPLKPALPTVETMSLEYQEKEKKLRMMDSLLGTKKNELDMARSLLKTMAAPSQQAPLERAEKVLASREDALQQKEVDLSNKEQTLLQQLSELDTLELRVHMLQKVKQERQAAMGMVRQHVAVQTDGGHTAKQAEEEHKSALRSELTQHRAQLDAIRAQISVDEGNLRRTKEALSESQRIFEDQRSALENARSELRALETRMQQQEEDNTRAASLGDSLQKKIQDSERRLKELMGEEGSVANKRMTVDALASVEAELMDKQRALREAAAQLGAAADALDADTELAQRRAQLASLVPLQDKHHALQAEIDRLRSERSAVILEAEELATKLGPLRYEAETLEVSKTQARALKICAQRYLQEIQTNEQKIRLKQRVETALDSLLECKKAEVAIAGPRGQSVLAEEELKRLKEQVDARRSELQELDSYVHIGLQVQRRKEELKEIEKAITAAQDGTSGQVKKTVQRLRLEKELQELTDKIVVEKNRLSLSNLEKDMVREQLKSTREQTMQMKQQLQRAKVELGELELIKAQILAGQAPVTKPDLLAIQQAEGVGLGPSSESLMTRRSTITGRKGSIMSKGSVLSRSSPLPKR